MKTAGQKPRRVLQDARAVATRRRLDAGFVELLRRCCYDDLRVAEITTKSGVGRSTFYAHYSSKEELLRSQFRRIVTPMMLVTDDATHPLDCTRLFAHILTARVLFENVMRGGAGNKVMRECFAEHLRRCIKRGMAVRGDVPKKMMVGFVVHGLMAVMEYAATSKASATPEALQEIFQRLVGERIG